MTLAVSFPSRLTTNQNHRNQLLSFRCESLFAVAHYFYFLTIFFVFFVFFLTMPDCFLFFSDFKTKLLVVCRLFLDGKVLTLKELFC